MTFAELSREAQAEVVLEGFGMESFGVESFGVLWLEEGAQDRPSLLPGTLWVTARAGPALAEWLAAKGAAGLWCETAEDGLEAVCLARGLGLARLPERSAARLARARLRLAEAQRPALMSAAGALAALAGLEHERDLLEGLHRLVRAPLALVAPWGEPLHWVGALPTALPSEAGEGPGHLVLAAGESLLVAFGPAASLAPWRGLLALAARLLAVRGLEARAQRGEEEAFKQALFDDLLVGEADPSRARAFGFETGVSFTLALLEGAPVLGRHRLAEARRREGLLELRRAAGGYLERLGVPYLLSERGGRAALLWQSFSPEAETATLLRSLSGARLGYSAKHDSLSRVSQAYREALIALKTARRSEAVGFGTLDPVSWVLLQQSPEDLRALVERFLPLPDALLRTLEAWLQGEKAHDVAAELHVHPNTLRYRLAQVEAALGQSLKAPETLAQLHLALRAKGLLEDEG